MSRLPVGKIELFQDLSVADLQFLEARSVVNEYAPMAMVFTEGEESSCFFVVLEGILDIIKALGTEAERVIRRIEAGEVIGEMSLLYPGRSRSASCRAVTHCRLLEVPLDDLDTLLKRSPSLSYRLMQLMSLRLRQTEEASIQDLKQKIKELARTASDLQQARLRLREQEQLDYDLSLARRIQEGILPNQTPELKGWDLAAVWQPARTVSGDFYDFIPLGSGRLAIVIGDVTGKSVPAALLMTVVCTVLRTLASEAESPGVLLTRANDLLYPVMPMSMFATCHVSVLDLVSGHLTFANAGHCLPLHLHRDRSSELRTTGFPVGLLPGASYEEAETQLDPGDRVLFFSDGVEEAHNPDRVMYGIETLDALYTQWGQQPSWDGREIIQRLLANLNAFIGSHQDAQDDITLICLTRASRG